MSPSGEKIAAFSKVSRCRWSLSGEHFLIGTAQHLTIYDSKGNELQRISQHPEAIPHMNSRQHRWSRDGRFLVDCVQSDLGQETVIPIIFDLKTGKKVELKPHSFFDPIEISPDSKWLCIRRRSSKSKTSNITIVNLIEGVETESLINPGGYGSKMPPFAFSSRTDQAMTLDGVFKICLLYTSPSPRDGLLSRMPSSA